MAGRPAIEFEGRQYRFVDAERSPRQKGESDFRLVPEAKARELVTRMAERLAKVPDERLSWKRLADKLTDRRGGAGILLMRNAPPSGGSAARPAVEAPLTTPSQARAQVATQDWIEIKIEYTDGSPFDGNCIVELPDGRRTEGAPDSNGVIRVDGINPGSCKLSFPQLDAAAWDGG